MHIPQEKGIVTTYGLEVTTTTVITARHVFSRFHVLVVSDESWMWGIATAQIGPKSITVLPLTQRAYTRFVTIRQECGPLFQSGPKCSLIRLEETDAVLKRHRNLVEVHNEALLLVELAEIGNAPQELWENAGTSTMVLGSRAVCRKVASEWSSRLIRWKMQRLRHRELSGLTSAVGWVVWHGNGSATQDLDGLSIDKLRYPPRPTNKFMNIASRLSGQGQDIVWDAQEEGQPIPWPLPSKSCLVRVPSVFRRGGPNVRQLEPKEMANLLDLPLNLRDVIIEDIWMGSEIGSCPDREPGINELLNFDHFEKLTIHGVENVVVRYPDPADTTKYQLFVPQSLEQETIAWYYALTGHAGQDRMEKSMRPFMWFPDMRGKIKEYVSTCDSCQRNKNVGQGLGHLPPKEDVSEPWEEVAVDLVGPWKMNIPNISDVNFYALTIIDTATTLTELVRMEANTALYTARLFASTWLSRYPRPLRVIHDPGTQFTGAEFQAALVREGIRAVPCTVKNPQSNAVIERMHKTIGDLLRTSLRSTPPRDVATATELVDSALATCVRALRMAVHTMMGVSPGALEFRRDMLLPFPVIVDYEMIRQKRQATIDYNATIANKRRRFSDYEMGEEVLLISHHPDTLQERTEGPFPIIQVHVNGTVPVERPGGVLERFNVRRIRPCVEELQRNEGKW